MSEPEKKQENREVTVEEIACYGDPRCRSCFGKGKHHRVFGFDFQKMQAVKGRPAVARITCENDEIACGCALKRFNLRQAGRLHVLVVAAIDEKVAKVLPETPAAEALRHLQEAAAAVAEQGRQAEAAETIAQMRAELVKPL